MKLLLQTLSDSIPKPSERVRKFFDQSVSTDDVGYKTRCFYACIAIGISTINTIGYGIAVTSCFTTALFYRNLTIITEHGLKAAEYAHKSLYFAAAMTAYLFMSILQRSGYQLKLEPLKSEPLEPIDPYLLMPECRALVLEAQEVDFEKFLENSREINELSSQSNSMKLFADGDLNLPEEFSPSDMAKRPDLTLVITPSQKKGLVISKNQDYKKLIKQKKVVYHQGIQAIFPSTELNQSSPAESSNLENNHFYKPDPNIPLLNSFSESSFFEISNASCNSLPTSTSTGLIPIKDMLNFAWKIVVGEKHIFKDMKYRHVMTHLLQTVAGGDGLAIYNAAEKINESSDLKTKCMELYGIITQPQKYDDIRTQHCAYIKCLQEAHDLITDNSPEQFKIWVQFVAYLRFGGIELYEYCKSLVEKQTLPFNTPITLDNFAEEFYKRNEKVAKLSSEEGMPVFARLAQQAKGNYNINNFLAGSNVPWCYGYIELDKKRIKILRHGTPIEQNDLIGFLNVTSDYIAFIEASKRENKNILHIILENSIPKSEIMADNIRDRMPSMPSLFSYCVGKVAALVFGGDESGRVKARLELGKHENFYPLALRLDGKFIQPHSFQPKSIAAAKKEFLDQMYGQDTGFTVPDKLRQNGLSQEDFTKFMDQICNTYFKDQETFNTLKEFQAFIVLTYAEIALSLCQTLKIDYLEAFCKDDIDRGNAMKAIIALHYLYRSNKFVTGSEDELQKALVAIMVNLLAAPLIVRKNEIIESRLNYFFNVVEVMKKTVKKSAKPDVGYAGRFTTPSKPHQGLTPIGTNCRTEEEYQTYLEQVKNGSITLKTTLEKNVIELSKLDVKETERQLTKDITRINMHLNSACINPHRNETFSNIKGKILKALKEIGIENGNTDPILSAFTQTIGSDLTESLRPLFDNQALFYSLILDADKMHKDKTSGLFMETKSGKVSIAFVCLFKVISTDLKNIATVRTMIEIPDHRKAGITITTTVD